MRVEPGKKATPIAPELICGNIYMNINSGNIYIYVYAYHTLINLETGDVYAREEGFGHRGEEFTDVTDLYFVKHIHDNHL